MMQLTHADGKTFLLERLFDYRISKLAKVARTFQNIRLFAGMTLLENLLVAQHNALMRASGLTFLGLIGAPTYHRSRAPRDRACALLARAHRTCWIAPTMPPATSPMATSGGWRSRARCARSRRCSASMSRRQD